MGIQINGQTGRITRPDGNVKIPNSEIGISELSVANNAFVTGIMTVTSDLNVSGNIAIGGTLTYEDVTNVDSVGLITARNGLHVTGGFIGAGTTDPQCLLHLEGNKSSSTKAKIILADNQSGNGDFFFESGGSGSENHLKIGEGSDTMILVVGDVAGGGTGTRGFVGIGTNNPLDKLSVVSSFSEDSVLRLQGGTSAGRGSGIRWMKGATQVGFIGPESWLFGGSNSSSDFCISAAGQKNISITSSNVIDIGHVNGMRITATGDVGINSTAPERRLDVLETASQTVAQFQTSGQTKALSRYECHGDQPVFVGAARSNFNIEMNGNDVMTINHTNNNVEISGNLKVASGKGINFGAVQGGGASSDLLDDYEEGQYLPQYGATASSGTVTYSNYTPTGIYTKIGRSVWVWVDFIIGSATGQSGVPYITLPFTSQNDQFDSGAADLYYMGSFVPWDVSTTFTTYRATGWITRGVNYMYMYAHTSGNAGHSAWNLNTTGRIAGMIHYTTNT